MTQRLQTIFSIHPGEGRMVAIVLAYAILLFSSNVLAITASLGLFFEIYDVANLPFAYVLLAFIGPLLSLIYIRLNSRFTLAKALLSVHAFLLLSLLLLPLLLNWSGNPTPRFFLPVYLEINVTLTFTSFWNLLGRLYNLRQGKRLFPFLSSGEHIATIVAGFVTSIFVARLGTINLYWVSALSMMAAIAFLIAINRANRDKMEASLEDDDDDAQQTRSASIRQLLKEPYVQLLFAMVVLYTISVTMVENISFSEAEIRFPTASGMASFVGLFMGIYGVLGLLVQWFIAGRLLDRFGVIATIFSLPGGLILILFVFAVVGSFDRTAVALFWLAVGANLFAYTADAPYITARNVVLQPLPAYLRTQVQTTAIGIAYPLATGLAGLLLLLLLDVLQFDSVQLSFATLIVLVFWLTTATRLGRSYKRRLREALQARSLGGTVVLQTRDSTSISILEEALSDPHPPVVLSALHMLIQAAPERLTRHLPDLLEYPDNEVRIAALRQLAARPWRGAQSAAERLLGQGNDPAVRAAALSALYAINPQIAESKLPELAQDTHRPVRQAALASMCLGEDPALRQAFAVALNDLVGSKEADDRILAARVIGETITTDTSEQFLLPLLQDDDPRVLEAALMASRHVYTPGAGPILVSLLANNSVRNLAVEALVSAGETTLPLLQAATQEPHQDAHVVSGVALVCGRLAGPNAIAILEGLLAHPSAEIFHNAVRGLSRCGYQATAETRELVETRFEAQLALVTEIVVAQVDVGSEQPVQLAADALEQRRRMETDMLFLLLSFLVESQPVLSAREALRPRQDDDDKRAFAFETLDILLDRDTRSHLFPLIGEEEPEQRLSEIEKYVQYVLVGREQRLRELVTAEGRKSERWTRICALYALGDLGDGEVTEEILNAALRFSDDPVLVETALYILAGRSDRQVAIARSHPALAGAVAAWQARGPQAMILLQKMASLKQVGLFGDLPNEELEVVACLMDETVAEADEIIIHKGELGSRMYVVVDGRLQVHDADQTLATLQSGDVVGEMSLLDAEPRSASVTAVTRSVLLQMDQEPFYELLNRNPLVSRELLVLLSRRLRGRSALLPANSISKAALRNLPIGGAEVGIRVLLPIQRELMDLDKLFVLKGIQLFSGLTDDHLQQVAVLLKEVDLTGGQLLFHEGDPGHSLYIIARGQMRVHFDGHTLAYANEGEVIGEMALLESQPRSASVTAVVPTLLLRLDRQPFFELLDAEPQLGLNMVRTLSARLRARPLESAA